MEITKDFIFQVDSPLVKEYYEHHPNYLIEYSPDIPKEYCIIYFSSNDIYYPNNEIAFRDQLIQKNRFEWYKTRITKGQKHIFIRDIKKQWFLEGINSQINNPYKLYLFLKEETKGYKTITVGSSAGGFAAVIFGQLLGSIKILSFNGNFEIRSKLLTSNEFLGPLLFKYKDDESMNKWYDSKYFITNPDTIFYFQSIYSKQDIFQYNHIKEIDINRIQFKNSHHGIPFFKTNLNYVLNCNTEQLISFSKQSIHPFMFSVHVVGIFRTVIDFTNLAFSIFLKILNRKLLKFK